MLSRHVLLRRREYDRARGRREQADEAMDAESMNVTEFIRAFWDGKVRGPGEYGENLVQIQFPAGPKVYAIRGLEVLAVCKPPPNLQSLMPRLTVV